MTAVTVSKTLDTGMPQFEAILVAAPGGNSYTYTSKYAVVDAAWVSFDDTSAAAADQIAVTWATNVVTFTYAGTARAYAVLILGHG
jgi:hypothetical protein